MKKKVLFFIFLFLLLPHVTLAFTSLNASTPNPIVGEEFYVQFNIDYLNLDGSDPEIQDYNACVTYDESFFSYVSATWNITSAPLIQSPGKICFNKEKAYVNWPAKISPFVLTFKVLKSGLTEIRTTHNGTESHYGNGDPIAQSFSGIKVNPVDPSSDTTIGSLGVRGYTIHPTFSKTYYEYYLTVDPEVSSVIIDAKPMNNKQTIIGNGTAYLNYGLNVVHVIVRAQDGSTREYNINITRTDNRNGDTNLRVLSVSDTAIKFEEGKTNYEAIVSRSVDSVMIDARPSDPNATLIGTGRKKLEIGDNTFELTLKTSNKGTPVEVKYTLKITRSNEELEKIKQSSKLQSLSINNLTVDLTNDKQIFYTGIFNSSSSINLDAKPESPTAEVDIQGNQNLQVGLNEVTITVTENNEEKTEYKIIVYKIPSSTNINNLSYITDTKSDMSYNIDEKATNKLTTSQLKYLQRNKYKLYYNAVDLHNALIYQITFDGQQSDADVEISFLKQEDNTPTYKTTLKEGYEMMLFVGDKYKDDQPVKIYTYNEKGKYKLLTDGVKVQNGYIEFKTNGDEYYVFTTSQLIKNVGPVTAFINQYKMYLLGGIAGLVIIYLLIKLIKKQKAIKRKNEPLY